MALRLDVPKTAPEMTPRITVLGVGGAGGNAVNNMIRLNLEGVEFVVANTDSQALAQSGCERKIQLGVNITQGLGAGSRPDVGRAAAEETLDQILDHLEGANMVFVTAGMGGGTGTGAAPVIARAARERGILTVGVVTKPFQFEGVHRMRLAEAGIEELQQFVDTLIIIPNQNLFRVANERTTFADAFKMADDVLHAGVRGVTDLMVMPGLINLDFADIRSVMTEMGKAMMGTGEAEGDQRSIGAAEAAINNPLLEDTSMKGARGVLINITGGQDLTLFEVDEAANRIREEVDPDANIIFGSTFDDSLEGRMRVSVVATGIDADAMVTPRPAAYDTAHSIPSPKFGAVGADQRGTPAAAVARGATARVEPTPQQEPVTLDATHIEPQLRPERDLEDARAALRATREDRAASPAVSREEPVHPMAVEQDVATDGYDQVDDAEEQLMAAAAEASRPRTPIAQPPEAVREEVPVAVTRTAQAGGRPVANSPFIAPRPVMPTRRSPAPVAPAEPFAARSRQESEGGERRQERPVRERSRAQSLFAKVTGAARAFQAATAEPSVPAATRSRPAPEPRRSAPAPTREEPAQPRLSGLDSEPQDHVHEDEELMDIPAFLRRQAN
jgi:cell division protein FtsZ